MADAPINPTSENQSVVLISWRRSFAKGGWREKPLKVKRLGFPVCRP
jgi:hypothetical protein